MEILLDTQGKLCVKDKNFNLKKNFFIKQEFKNNRIVHIFEDSNGLVMVKEAGFNFDSVKIDSKGKFL